MLRSSLLFVLLLLLSLQLFGSSDYTQIKQNISKEFQMLKKQVQELKISIAKSEENYKQLEKEYRDSKSDLEKDKKEILELKISLENSEKLINKQKEQLTILNQQLSDLKNSLIFYSVLEILISLGIGFLAGYIVNNLTNRT